MHFPANDPLRLVPTYRESSCQDNADIRHAVAYRSVLPLAWPLLTKGLETFGPRRQPVYDSREVFGRVVSVAAHLAYGVIDVDIQRQLIDPQHLAALERKGCSCIFPRRRTGVGHEADRVQHCFAHGFAYAIELALTFEWTDEEWARGMPRCIEHRPPQRLWPGRGRERRPYVGR